MLCYIHMKLYLIVGVIVLVLAAGGFVYYRTQMSFPNNVPDASSPTPASQDQQFATSLPPSAQNQGPQKPNTNADLDAIASIVIRMNAAKTSDQFRALVSEESKVLLDQWGAAGIKSFLVDGRTWTYIRGEVVGSSAIAYLRQADNGRVTEENLKMFFIKEAGQWKLNFKATLEDMTKAYQ